MISAMHAARPPLDGFLLHPGQVTRHLERLLLAVAARHGPAAAMTVAVAAAVMAAGRAWLLRRRHAALAAGARTVEILAPPVADPAGGAALWANLAGLMRPPLARWRSGQPHLAWEYSWTAGRMTVSLWVPGGVPPGMAERAVEAAWPGAHARTTSPAAAPLPAGSLATGGTLRLARTEVLPLKTDHDADPLRALAAAGTGLGPAEHAVVQVLARPATGRRVRRARRAVRRLRDGQPARPITRLLDLASPGPRAAARRASARADPDMAAGLRAAAAKAVGPQWETLIRYAAATALPAGGGRGAAAAARPGARARLGHGPVRGAELARPPPPGIPGPGPGTRPLGTADAGPPREVAITVADARHHMRIIGATGAGKTTLILGQLLADAAAGCGAVFIDPKGDAVTALLPRLPETCIGKVVLFDPAARAAPPCLNVLQGAADGSDTDVITDNITGIFRRIYAAFWGPRTDDIFRAAVLTLLRSVPAGSGQVTLADIPVLLGSDAYRRRVTAAVADPVLHGFWSWYEQLSEAARAQATGPLLNKLRAFLLRPFVRAAIAAGPSTFTMTTVLDSGGLLLARLPKGILGEETARLLGSFLVAATWQAAAARARLPEHRRPDAGLYLDECHNFLNLPYPLEDMLAEARAYRLSVTLAHQNLAQLPPDLREGISANARSQVIFTASPEDARILERHTLPALAAHDLSHLGGYQAAARLVAGGAQTAAFTLRTQPLPPPVPGRARLIRSAARRLTAALPRQRKKGESPVPEPAEPGRLTVTPGLLAEIAGRLTARDRWLLAMLREHRVLTTSHITQLAFGTSRAATARMVILHRCQLADRFRPLAAAGSAPWHFVLGPAGAHVLAAQYGLTPGQLGYRRDRTLALALSPRLGHDTGAAGFFTALAAHARTVSGGVHPVLQRRQVPADGDRRSDVDAVDNAVPQAQERQVAAQVPVIAKLDDYRSGTGERRGYACVVQAGGAHQLQSGVGGKPVLHRDQGFRRGSPEWVVQDESPGRASPARPMGTAHAGQRAVDEDGEGQHLATGEFLRNALRRAVRDPPVEARFFAALTTNGT